MDAWSSRIARADAADSNSGSVPSGSTPGDRSSEVCAGSSHKRGHTPWLSSNLGSSWWVSEWASRQCPQKQQQNRQSFISRIFSKRTTARRDPDDSKDIRGGRPTFERRRRRYRTVSWKYKKSIGFVASFIFVCNQILAPGLTSMPLTLIEYGWLPSLLVNLLFCLVSTICSLLLLRSVTLIEGNQNFDERFEYSATLRHFFSPPGADLPSGEVVTRGVATSATKGAATQTSTTPSAERETRSEAEKPASHSAIWNSFYLCKRFWNATRALTGHHRCSPVGEDAPPTSALSSGMVGGGTSTAHKARETKAEGATTPSETYTKLGNGKRGEGRSPAGQEAGDSTASKCNGHETKRLIYHPSNDSASTCDSDLSYSLGAEERRAAQPDEFRMHVARCLHPGYLLMRALCSLRVISNYKQMQQQLPQPQQTPHAQLQPIEEHSLQQRAHKGFKGAAALERNPKEETAWLQRARETDTNTSDQFAAAAGTKPAMRTTTTALGQSTSEAGTLSSIEREGEACAAGLDTRELRETPEALKNTATAPAVVAESAAGVALLHPETGSHPSEAQHDYKRSGLIRRFLTMCCLLGRMQRCTIGMLLSPFRIIRWMCGIPHRLMQCLYRAMVRPPPLLPSSFPRLLSWLLHLNTFLSTCSAALLVAYCIDCLLLRVFSCSLFLPLLPTHISSGLGLDPHASWHAYLTAVGHWFGAAVALILQPFHVLVSVGEFLYDLLAVPGAAVGSALAAATRDVVGNRFSETPLANGARVAELFAQHIRQVRNMLLVQFSQALDFIDTVVVHLIPDWLPRTLSSLFSSAAGGFAGGFIQELQISGVYGVPHVPFLYVLSSQQQIEEVFSGVCSSRNSIGASCTAARSSPVDRYSSSAGSLPVSPATCGSSTVAPSSFAGESRLSFAHYDPSSPMLECLPHCVSHMGISVGYIITAAICLHLAAADLQENARMQLLSFGAIIAAVLQISCSAALMLLYPASATASSFAGKATDLGRVPPHAGAIASASLAGNAFSAQKVIGSLRWPAAFPFTASERENAASSAGCMVGTAAALTVPGGTSPARPALPLPLLPASSCKPLTTPATAYTTPLTSRNTCTASDYVSRRTAAALTDVPSGDAYMYLPGDTVLDADAAATASSWPSMIVRGSGMGSLVSTFVDAYSYSNSLPSWANEVKDNIPVTRTLFMSTTFACVIYFLFGVLCAAAFPTFSASTNVLAAMLPSCQSHIAAACICFFHVFALLPNIVTSQISRRYDLLNMAICLDKPSAFYVASTMPWMLYWLITFRPMFAIPSQLLTLLSNVLLNFAAPALVYVYALHATAPPSVPVVDRMANHAKVKTVPKEGTSSALDVGRTSAGPEPELRERKVPDAASTTPSSTSFTRSSRHQDSQNFLKWWEQQENDEAYASSGRSGWQGERHKTSEHCAGTRDNVNTSGTGVSEVVTPSAMSQTLPTCLSRTSSFTYGATSPSPAQPHTELAAPQAQPSLRRYSSTGGGKAVDQDWWQETYAAGQPEEYSGLTLQHAGGDLLLGRLAMHAVPEEERETEDEGHAAEVEKHTEDENSYSLLPLSLSHLREQNSHASVATCSSGGMSRWSTSCYGKMRAPYTSGDENFVREESGGIHAFAGLTRTQSHNVLSFQSRTGVGGGRIRSSANNFVESNYEAGEAGKATSLGEPSFHRGSKGDEALTRGAGAAMTSIAGLKSSTMTEEKLGKMRVAGAVAGGGGARSREVQRQLQTWLEEYSRQMPDSEVAQLLQRQQREEQQEKMRLQQQETQLNRNLRKKVESQWRRQQIFRTEEESSPSPTCGGGGPPSLLGAVLETTADQNRSSSLPPYIRGGDAAAAGGNGSQRNAGMPPRQEGTVVAGTLLQRRRGSRSLSYTRRLLSQSSTGVEETISVTSAASDVGQDTSAAAGVESGSAGKSSPAATLSTHIGVSSLAAVGEKGPHRQLMANLSKQKRINSVGPIGYGASAQCAELSSAKGETAAAVEVPSNGSVGRAASQGQHYELQWRFHNEDAEPDSMQESERTGSKRAAVRKPKDAGRGAASSCTVLSKHDAFSGTAPMPSDREWNRDTSNHIRGDNTDGTKKSDTDDVAGGIEKSEMSRSAGASIVCAADIMHEVEPFTSLTTAKNPVGEAPAGLTDAAVEGEVVQRQVTQSGELKTEVGGASPPAPTFVRRTSKKCARIDSVSVALQQRRRQQLLKQERQQQEQQLAHKHENNQSHSWMPKEQDNEEYYRGDRQMPRLDEQEKGTKTQHQNRHWGLLCPEIFAQDCLQRTSARHATLVSRPRSSGGLKADALHSCAATVSDITPTAEPPLSNHHAVAREVRDASASGMRELYVEQSRCASVQNELRCSKGRRRYESSGSDEANNKYCTIRERTTQTESGRHKLDVCAVTAAADLAGERDNSQCIVPADREGINLFKRSADGHELRSARGDVGGVEGERHLRRQQVDSEKAQLDMGQESITLSGVSPKQTGRQDAQESAAKAGRKAGRGAPETKSCSLQARSEMSSPSHSWQSEWPEGRHSTSYVPGAALEGVTGEGKGEDGIVCTARASSEKVAESPAPATEVLDVELLTSGHTRQESSPFSPYWRRSAVILEKLQNSVRSRLMRVRRSVTYVWNSEFLLLLSHLPGLRSVEQTSPCQQQQHQLVNKNLERVSVFPWLKSTEEQLVATYALLAVVLYSAAAALADEVWSQLEAARFYVWKYSCRLASLLWALESQMLVDLLRPLRTWTAAMLTTHVAEAKHLFDYSLGNYVQEYVCSWISAGAGNLQRLTGCFARVLQRPVQQIYASKETARDLYPEPCLEGGLLQSSGSFFDEAAATTVGIQVPVAQLEWESSAAHFSLSARMALPKHTRFLQKTEEREQIVSSSAGLSAETFSIGLLLLVACTVPLLRYASPRNRGVRVAGVLRGERVHT